MRLAAISREFKNAHMPIAYSGDFGAVLSIGVGVLSLWIEDQLADGPIASRPLALRYSERTCDDYLSCVGFSHSRHTEQGGLVADEVVNVDHDTRIGLL